MKTSEFYQRAFADAAFRRKKLAEFRYLKNIYAALVWIGFGFGVPFWLYTGIFEGSWTAHLSFLLTALLGVSAYSDCSHRVAALAVFEKGPAPVARADPGVSRGESYSGSR